MLAQTITAGGYVTLGLAGTPTEYNVSGITKYTLANDILNSALKYGDVYYSGNGKTVSLTLSAAETTPKGYEVTGFSLSPSAELYVNGNVYSFLMPDQNVTVNAMLTENKLELANAGNNNTAIANASSSGKYYNVTLKDRTLYKDGAWNTLCLPFGVTISGSDLDGAEARSLSTASLADGTLTLDFSTPVDALVAGTPYIIRWTRASDYEDDDAHNIVSPTFSAVTIDATDRPFNSTDGKVTFRGTYQPIEWTATNTSILFLGAANTLYYPQPKGDKNPSINACRAYFELSDGTQQARQFVLNFGEGDGSAGVSPATVADGDVRAPGWYTLDGRKLGGKPSAKGVYINSGRKVVIK